MGGWFQPRAPCPVAHVLRDSFHIGPSISLWSVPFPACAQLVLFHHHVIISVLGPVYAVLFDALV